MAFYFNEVIIVPMKPMKPCKYLGCTKLTEDKYCDQHKNFSVQERATATERGYGSKWRTARNRFLKVNPLCVRCKEEDRLVKATVVDHVKPHRGDKILFWDERNWQALCKRCHDKKTMTEDRYKEYKY